MTATTTNPPANPTGWAMPTLPPDVRADSVKVHGRVEADKFKWYRSEEAGRDLGDVAIKDWVQKHWHDYLRSKWLEHIQGKAFWIELKRCQFGVLQTQFRDHLDLMNQIVDMLKAGQENLDVLRWAISESRPIEDVKVILEAVDINSCHLVHFFDAIPPANP